MLTSAPYDLASSSSSSLHSATLAAAASSSVEAPADPGLSCAPSKTHLPVYHRQHPKKYRLSNYESTGVPSQVSWPTSFDSCPPPPLLSSPTSLHQHHQHHQHHQQQQQQQYQGFSCVPIKTEDFSSLPYSPSASFSSPAYVTQHSPLSSYGLAPTVPSNSSGGPQSMLAQQTEVKASYFGTTQSMPQLQVEPGGAYVTMLPNYGCPGGEVYFPVTSPGKQEPGIQSFYTQVGSGSDITAVYPADSSSFSGVASVPVSFERNSPALRRSSASEVKVGAAAAAAQVRPSHCPERELSLYKNKMETKLCDVCEDTAAGFHCGAFVCEACKKFFIRSWKADNSQRYQCTKSEACKITKDTRTHCQRCRYKKCMELRMVPPNMRPTESPDISAIPCRVCGAQSSGFHFGAITCEGCKGFFRRTIHERCNNSYTCSKSGKCVINVQTRNNCKACRFVKCLHVGMSKTGSRIGRQPNAIKHLCGEEIRAQLRQQQQQQQQPQVQPIAQTQHMQSVTSALQTQHQQTATSPMSTQQAHHQQSPMTVLTPQQQQQQPDIMTPPTLIPAIPRLPTPTPLGRVASAEVTSSVATLEANDVSASVTPVVQKQPLIPAEDLPSNAWSLTDFRNNIVLAWEKRHLDVNKQMEVSVLQEGIGVPAMTEDMDIKQVLDVMMDRFLAHTKQLVNFARRSPDFYVLSYPYQSVLVTEAIYSFTLIQLSVDFDLDRCEYNYFDFTKHEREIILRHFPSYEVICQHLVESGRLIKQCSLDHVELAMLSYLEFIRGDFSCCPAGSNKDEMVKANAIFAQLEERASAALQEYIERLKPTSALRGGALAQIHDALVRMNREHYDLVRALPQVARSSFSSLFNDMFRLNNPCDSTTPGSRECAPMYMPPTEDQIAQLQAQQQQQQQQQLQAEVSTTGDELYL